MLTEMASGDSGIFGSLFGAALGSLTGPDRAAKVVEFGLSVGEAISGIAK